MALRPDWVVSVLALLAWPGAAGSTETGALPASVRLVGTQARQQILLEERREGRWVGDLTPRASFRSDRPDVARVSKDGVVTPVSDGSATVFATAEGRTVAVPVSVEETEVRSTWSFRNHVQAVLTKAGCNSGACHGAAAGKNGFRLSLRGFAPDADYDAITRQALGRRIVPSAPSESLLLLKPTGALGHGGGVRFGPASLEYRVLSEWLADGAPAPSAAEPRVVALTTLPSEVRLERGDAQRLVVQARYSDGRIEDVTRWAKYSSADDAVARVDESGRVTVEGRGETAIAVWFASVVSRATVTSPFAEVRDPSVYRSAPRKNFIDDRNLAKLESLGIPPSPDAGDAAFLRRAYLDATGSLPPADLVTRFLDDPSPDKREKLVDRLLASPGYVDYWAYKWSDLLLVSSNKLPSPAVWSFSRFVRESVARNVGWDQFARAILTARGSTLSQGAANFYAIHRDPVDLTESTSMAFLGLSLTCARCHNHPMEKWTQDQYYGLANLFARVRLKDGGSAGEVIVVSSDEGAIRHPRTGAQVLPQPLDADPLAMDAPGDRRAALAEWMARPENPYFARAVVNRVWRNFFGRGLIDPEDDLRATNPPSDEALLNGLVEDFVAHRYDVKHLVRTVMTSAVYARSSAPVPGNEHDLRFLSHYVPKRLSAEVLLDSVSDVTGVPTNFPGYPRGWRSLQLPDSKVESPFLQSFGRPERLNTCSCERSSDPSLAQALHLANGPTVNDKLRDDNGSAAKAVQEGRSGAQILERLFLAALSRRPTASERERLLRDIPEPGATGDDAAGAARERRQAVEDLYWAVLTSHEFLFNH